MNEIINNIHLQKPHTQALAIVSVLLSLAAVLAVLLSIHRVEAVQELPGCLIAEAPGYRVVHSLCTILPTGSLVAGILAIMRTLRSRRKLWGIVLPAGGVTISVAVLIFYWVNLAHLASGHLH